MEEPLIDRAVYAALAERVGADFAAELVDTFVEEGAGMLAELLAAHQDGNAVRFRRAAHSLKSNGETFGAKRLAAHARALELNGIEAADAAAVARVAGEYKQVITVLKGLRNA
jgi:HPt (histidine-containing phosphotransfer) domain-containing protein